MSAFDTKAGPMTLDAIRKTRNTKPPRILIYGEHKIGKSSFGAEAKAPVFICAEDGLDNIDAEAFPPCLCFEDVLSALEALRGEHDFKTVVIDSLDWLEPLVWKSTVAEKRGRNGEKSIEDFAYAKGYTFALDLWERFLERLDILRDEKGMGVVLVAHGHQKAVELPGMEPFKQWQPKLHAKAAAKIMEWVDVAAFATFEEFVDKADAGFGRTVSVGLGNGRRVLHLEKRPAHMAGNRYGMPATIEFPKGGAFAAFRKELLNAIQPKTKDEKK